MLQERGWKMIPVVDDEGKLVGVVTESELREALGAGG